MLQEISGNLSYGRCLHLLRLDVPYDGLYTDIDLCFKAIQLDPEFGNPYNDMGYLMRLGKLESSIKWFIRATSPDEPNIFISI